MSEQRSAVQCHVCLKWFKKKGSEDWQFTDATYQMGLERLFVSTVLFGSIKTVLVAH